MIHLPGHHCHQCRDRAQGSYGESKARSRVLESSLANIMMCQTVFAVGLFLEPALRAPKLRPIGPSLPKKEELFHQHLRASSAHWTSDVEQM